VPGVELNRDDPRAEGRRGVGGGLRRDASAIQAVQTLSRLNRAHPGKDTTYILDFVNSSDEILTAFRTYYETAELESATDPNLIYDLRAKLDAAGHYDDFEVERVAKVELNPVAALRPHHEHAMQFAR
jgi:type I restriction enzyme R subunit